MWGSNKKHSGSDIEKKKESKTVKFSIKNFARILRFKFKSNILDNIPENINISTNDDIEINIEPYYDKNDKCIYIPCIYSYTPFYNTTRVFVTKVPLSRKVIMKCIADYDESEEE